MKLIALLITLICLQQLSFGQKTNPNYDQELAEKLGADDYGMKTYVLVILKTGTNTSNDVAARNEAIAGHMANMSKMVKKNQLVVSGPFMENSDGFRGLFILNASSIEEARSILESDPAIKANYLKPELYPWYGSAALPEYLPASDKIWKKGI